MTLNLFIISNEISSSLFKKRPNFTVLLNFHTPSTLSENRTKHYSLRFQKSTLSKQQPLKEKSCTSDNEKRKIPPRRQNNQRGLKVTSRRPRSSPRKKKTEFGVGGW